MYAPIFSMVNLRHINSVKSFTLLSLSGNLANYTLAFLVSLHYIIYLYKDRVQLATCKLATSTSENGKN